MHTSNIHEIRKKAAVSIAVKIINGNLLRTVWCRICNIETEKIPHQLLNLPCRWRLEGAFRAMKGVTRSHRELTSANPMPRKREPPPQSEMGVPIISQAAEPYVHRTQLLIVQTRCQEKGDPHQLAWDESQWR